MYSFNAEKTKENIIKWLHTLKDISGLQKVVIGVSGGKDSTVCAALCAEAFGKENVLGIIMPNGEQKDINDAIKVCSCIGIDYKIVNIKPMYDTFIKSMKTASEISKDALINLQPRIRMSVLYSIGQSNHMRVCGTGNLSERTLGYFTKWGDGACDFNPIGNFTVQEVIAIGKTFKEIPVELIEKTPSDGLTGMSDEEKLGIKYIDVHNYLRGTANVPFEVMDKIEEKTIMAEHKVKPIPIYPNF